MNPFRLIIALLSVLTASASLAQTKLTGTPIGTSEGFNYELGAVEYDIAYRLFDGDHNTYFATYERSYTWAGLDLGTPHVITRVGWAPRKDPIATGRVVLAVIQGANRPDFLDALPLYIITEEGAYDRMDYGDVDCSRGFRYVRYVGPNDARCNLAELEFYGIPGEGDDSHLFQFTNLPTVAINTVDSEEPYDKEHEIESNVIIIDNHRIDTDKPAGVRERGNASRAFPKKPWRIKFDKKQQILNAPASAKKWTLINNYGDKTLMRNIISFEIARRLGMEYVPFCRPVDVVLNGEYKGCYQLCDQVDVRPSRVDVTEMETSDIRLPELTGGYLLEIDGYADQEAPDEWFMTSRGLPVTIKSPDDGGTEEQYNYIKDYMNYFEELLYAADFADQVSGYRSVLDIDSFLKHFITGELSGNTDTYWSTYIYKDRNDPTLYVGPVWDFDLGFDNDNRTYPVDQFSTYLFDTSSASAAGSMREHVRRIIYRDPATRSDITRIWSLARNDRSLTAGSLNEYVDATAELIGASQRLNFMRWPILNQMVHQNPRALGSFDAEVNAVKQYITKRFTRLDALMHYDPDLSSVGENTVAGSFVKVEGRRIVGDSYFEVFSLDGVRVYEGDAATGELALGIYIVRQGHDATKVAIK